MFGSRRRKNETVLQLQEIDRKIAAISRSQALIEFDLEGNILDANDNFLRTMGYALEEIQGRHHRTFMDPVEAGSPAYAEFWRNLNAGRFVATKFRRLAKGEREVWLQASYNPVMDADGRPLKVIKLAVDITAGEQEAARRETKRLEAETAQSGLVEVLAANLSKLSSGDLTARITQDMEGDHARVKDDFNSAVDSLRQTLDQVMNSVSGLRGGANEISSAADDLSRRTEHQAASLEETAAALDEITATVKRSAEGARQAATVAGEARGEADRSGVVVREAVKAMDGIRKSSDQISDITSVIDEIAFQTNLLALNAGVEAARAGDAGRGFAVVASEVRALAQRSAEAAKEIKTLISNSGAEVAQGVKLVDEAGAALGSIAGKVSEIDALATEIAAAAQEQSLGLSQINIAVNQMDQVTQQNAAMVEQTTAAAANLKSEAESLDQLINHFQTGQAMESQIIPMPGRGGLPIALKHQRDQLRVVVNGGPPSSWTEF